ncbi:hypothetical protein [Dietzia sp.]|uniref:hypothetical protein n=1 Tax=Dietzia sp. TaxID=1871616 RepID=UPI002FDA64EC
MGNELPRGPVLGQDLRRHLSRVQIREHYRTLWRGVYVRRDVRPGLAVRSRALALQYPGAVLVGWSAAQVWRHPWIPAGTLPQVACPMSRHSLPGREFSRLVPPERHIREVDGVQVADPEATAAELCRRLSFVEAVVALDGLERAQPGTAALLAESARRRPSPWAGPRAIERVLAAVSSEPVSPSRDCSWLRAQLFAAGHEDFRPGLVVPVRGSGAEPRVGDGAQAGSGARADANAKVGTQTGSKAMCWRPLLASAHARTAIVEGEAPRVPGWRVVALPYGYARREAALVVRRVDEVLGAADDTVGAGGAKSNTDSGNAGGASAGNARRHTRTARAPLDTGAERAARLERSFWGE